tara:strand:+ start:348 stop:647 length:300 start_codon:yes stop_codon:yes gene_type:complete
MARSTPKKKKIGKAITPKDQAKAHKKLMNSKYRKTVIVRKDPTSPAKKKAKKGKKKSISLAKRFGNKKGAPGYIPISPAPKNKKKIKKKPAVKKKKRPF